MKLEPIQTSFIWEKIEAERSFQRPTSREGHAMVYLNDKNKYLIFGGISITRYADIFTLSTSNYFKF